MDTTLLNPQDNDEVVLFLLHTIAAHQKALAAVLIEHCQRHGTSIEILETRYNSVFNKEVGETTVELEPIKIMGNIQAHQRAFTNLLIAIVASVDTEYDGMKGYFEESFKEEFIRIGNELFERFGFLDLQKLFSGH